MIKDDSFFSSDEEDNVNIDMPNLGGLLLDEGTNIKNETDAFEDAGKREKIHIHYQKRNNRKTWTKIEGIEKDMAKKISKKCLIVGHPRHDRVCYKKTKIKNQKFSVGMVSRFDVLNIFDDRLNFENI